MKHSRVVRICIVMATASVLLCGSGSRSFVAARQHAAISAGGLTGSAPAARRTHHFLVVSANESSICSSFGELLETIHVRLSRAMNSRGLSLDATSDPLVWVYFGCREQYREHPLGAERADPAFQDAYYCTRTNQVTLCADGMLSSREIRDESIAPHASACSTTGSQSPDELCAFQGASAECIRILTHEMAHQLAYNRGLQKRGVMYPLWVSEGLATFFEGSALAGAEPRSNPGRKRRLAELGASRALLPLHELSVLAGPGALRPSPADVYAQCWGLMTFLLQHHPDKLSAYLTELAQSPMGRRSSASLRQDFVRHFGPIGVLERNWRDYVASLPSEIDVADEPMISGF